MIARTHALEHGREIEHSNEIAQASETLALTVIVPVFNERFLVAELLRRVAAVSVPEVESVEIIVVDDGSTDGSAEILRECREEIGSRLKILTHPTNQGRGAALRSGIEEATGDLILFQNADLEYDPQDYPSLVRPFLTDGADAVYGSRFLTRGRRRVLYFRHSIGNRILTLMSNWFTDLSLTDMGTCYKVFRSSLLKSLPIRSNGFSIEPEITAKIAKRQSRIFEVPISYLGRTYQEGKKIGWWDGLEAMMAIFRFWVQDDLYVEDEYGSHILHSLERTRRFNRWMAEEVGSRCTEGAEILEIGAGIGNITRWLVPRDLYVASDINPHYLNFLKNFALAKPYLRVAHVDLEQEETFEPWAGRFDTVICLNVLEHVKDPVQGLRNIFGALKPGGKLILYVPQGEGLYSSLDEVLGHRCRYSREDLRAEAEQAGFAVEEMGEFNRFSVLGWWWNGKVLGKRSFGRIQLKIFDLFTVALRRFDRFLPWRGLGLVAVCRKPQARNEPGAGVDR